MGIFVGALVGALVGVFVGGGVLLEGTLLGALETVGPTVGALEGCILGGLDFDGADDGAEDGSDDGAEDGIPDGTSDGASDGTLEAHCASVRHHGPTEGSGSDFLVQPDFFSILVVSTPPVLSAHVTRHWLNVTALFNILYMLVTFPTAQSSMSWLNWSLL